MRLWKNEDARVPLALIGVLFVLISAGTSLKLSQMDARMASSMATNTDINAADTALLYARADLARIVNYAGMSALKQMGETPVIEFDPNSQYNTSGMETFYYFLIMANLGPFNQIYLRISSCTSYNCIMPKCDFLFQLYKYYIQLQKSIFTKSLLI